MGAGSVGQISDNLQKELRSPSPTHPNRHQRFLNKVEPIINIALPRGYHLVREGHGLEGKEQPLAINLEVQPRC